MNAPRRSPPALLQRFRHWLGSDLRVLRWVLLALYVSIVGGLFFYAWFHKGSDRLFLLILAGLVLGCQALFILGGGTMRLQRPIRKRRLWMPALAASLMFALLAVGLALAVSELFYLDEVFGQVAASLYWGFVVGSWLFWFLLFFLGTRKWPRMKALNRMIAAVLAGSLIELIIAAVSHAIVSRRPGCFVGLATMLGILAGLQVMVVAFGPAIILLFLRQRHRREQREDSPDQQPRFHFGLRMMFVGMLFFSLIFACIGFKVQKAKRNRYVESQAKEVQARIKKQGGEIQFSYDRHGDALDDYFRDPGSLRDCSWAEGSRVDDAALRELSRLTTLRGLLLGGTDVTNAGLAHLKDLTNLEQLDLSGTQVTSAGFASLRDLTSLESLNLAGVQIADADLAHLRELTNLEFLVLDDTPVGNSGLLHLRELPRLRHLDLGSTAVTNEGLESLKGLSDLRFLDLSHCDLRTIDRLPSLPKLHEIHLRQCRYLTDVRGLQRLPSLQQLQLSDCDSLPDVDGLRGVKQVQVLYLDECDALASVAGLQGMSSLEMLHLSSNPSLVNLDGLHDLPELGTLYLCDCTSLSNVDGLRTARQLVVLRLDGCTSLSSIDGLQGLPKLEQLDLSRCPLADLSALRGLPGLRTLQLADCDNLMSIQALQSLPKLDELTLDYSLALANLAVLRRLPKLETLHVSHSDGVLQEEKGELMRRLPDVDIQF